MVAYLILRRKATTAMWVIHFCVNLCIESGSLEMIVVVVLWVNVPVNIYGHVETVS